jgi:hypothetical protein
MLPSQESRVKTFVENKVKEDTRMDIIIPPQDAEGSPNPSAPPQHLGNQPLMQAYATISWKRTKILETSLKPKCIGKAFHRHNICFPITVIWLC